MKNSVLTAVARQLTKQGIDLDNFSGVTVQLSEGNETILTLRASSLEESQVYVEHASGHFIQMKMTSDDALLELRRQRRNRNRKTLRP